MSYYINCMSCEHGPNQSHTMYLQIITKISLEFRDNSLGTSVPCYYYQCIKGQDERKNFKLNINIYNCS